MYTSLTPDIYPLVPRLTYPGNLPPLNPGHLLRMCRAALDAERKFFLGHEKYYAVADKMVSRKEGDVIVERRVTL